MTTHPQYRIGLGHDTHRFTAGDHLQLGSVRVPADRAFLAHSDGDVLIHAIMDALLGAAALGDIGEMFPDNDPANRGRDSAEMLRQVKKLLDERNWKIINLDCIVFLQSPKLGPYKAEIQSRLAMILDLEPTQIGVKAKTGEGIGFIGREEGASAECVALLQSRDL